MLFFNQNIRDIEKNRNGKLFAQKSIQNFHLHTFENDILD